MRIITTPSLLRGLTLFALAGSLAIASNANAQPKVRDHRPDPRPKGPPSDGPREAPPAPRVEKQAARAGFVWITGRWQWRGRKWEWLAGHWERERAGKKWRDGRWDRKGDTWVYVDGAWTDGSAPTPAPTGPREAPPSPREEKQAARAGFVWVSGRWDWRGGKWEWLAGHWERERAGKKWRDGRWDRKGDTWEYVDGEWADGAPGPTPTGPREAPPSPREEKVAARAGFIWVSGRWDWRGGKWEWQAGRWERERAGKKWREGRWDRKDDSWAYVDGEWVDVGATPPDVPDRRPRRVWKLERPIVSSYWPAKGKVGTRIVIRGRNFPADTMVMWGGRELVRAARVKPTDIVFEVPRDATTSRIMLRTGARQIGVGTFEVDAGFDAAAEARKRDEERRRAAEAAWTERQKRLVADRAQRETALRNRTEERARTREERRRERADAIRAKWDRAFLAHPDTQDELTLHAQRVAELVRMGEIAELSNNGKLAVRIEIASARENDRHEQRMSALKSDFQATGGTP
jgi:hypothetical protein